MRTNSSPTAEAARLLAAREQPPRYAVAPAAPQTSTSQPDTTAARWCEWPRRPPAKRPLTRIWQTLQEIQARHA